MVARCVSERERAQVARFLFSASNRTGFALMRFILTLWAAVSLCAAPWPSVHAQPPAPGVDAALDAAREVRGAALQVTVLTFGNGAVLWERFGHNALVVSNTLTGESVAYNWGMFAFEQPNFLWNFLTGDTRYWVEAYPTDALLQHYVNEDRTARRQLLALTNVQKAALAEYVAWNAAEENRYYRYDYYLDNCSTRVRDAIDRVLGGVVASTLSDTPAAFTTWREETARVTDGDWPAFAGIHVALGRNADQPLSRWNEAFLPAKLAEHLTTLSVRDESGVLQPLVAHDTIVYQAARLPLPPRAPFRGFAALVIGALISGALFALGWSRAQGSRPALIALRVLATVWYTFGGVLGTALLLAGTVTKHAPYMGSNGTLFQLHPLLLIAAVLAPFAGGKSKASRMFARVALFAAALSLLGLLLQLTLLRQASLLVVVVTVPVHVAMVAVLALSMRPPTSTPEPAGAVAMAA